MSKENILLLNRWTIERLWENEEVAKSSSTNNLEKHQPYHNDAERHCRHCHFPSGTDLTPNFHFHAHEGKDPSWILEVSLVLGNKTHPSSIFSLIFSRSFSLLTLPSFLFFSSIEGDKKRKIQGLFCQSFLSRSDKKGELTTVSLPTWLDTCSFYSDSGQTCRCRRSLGGSPKGHSRPWRKINWNFLFSSILYFLWSV